MQADSAVDKSGKSGETPQQIVFVTGMHRSATSAFAGSLSLLGAALPARMPEANSFNPKGYFEPETVVQANDRLLETMQRHWNDCRPIVLPEDAARQAAEDHFTRLLRTEFSDGPIVALKDPRVSLVTPVWIDAVQRIQAQAKFVVMLRDPVAAASSIIRRDGLSEEAAIALWLRYTFDAEHHSRGQVRTIVLAEAFIRDPVATLGRVGEALALTWPIEPEAAQEQLADFIDTRLLDAWANMQTPLADFASEVHAAFVDLASVDGKDDTEALARIDHLRADFDARCPDIHGRMVFDQLGKAVTLQWHKDASDKATLEIQTALQQLAVDNDAALLDLDNTRADLDSTRLDLDDAKSTVVDLTSQVHDVSGKFGEALADLGRANKFLARARRRPLKVLNDYIKFKALKGLSKASPPLPSRMAGRFGRSAAKRDPNRSLIDPVQMTVPGAVGMAASHISVTNCATRYSGLVKRNPDLPDILIVSHDATRTGAPILTWNLVKSLKERYNVTTLCLRGGALMNDFAAHSVAVWEAEKSPGGGGFYAQVLNDICAKQSFVFAVTNSIESRHMLAPLKAKNVPTVTLLHEFSSYTKPKSAFAEAISSADQTVFSTKLTLEDAAETNYFTRTATTHVLPQGKCEVPTSSHQSDDGSVEQDRLTRLLRPEGQSPRRFIVMGAGYVQIRKGVDLFIDTAMRVLQRSDCKDSLFVWIGAGYDPDRDYAYSAYLQDQLRRAGVADRVLLVPETSEIETVYELSDALLVTSRLDPLPNVAIDAMCAGLPVLCFEQTTGVAEVLEDAGLKDACVAGYLDTGDLADKVAALASSEPFHADVVGKIRSFAETTFDFDAYAARIEEMALSAAGFPAQTETDIATIEELGRFDQDFCINAPGKNIRKQDAIAGCLDGVRTGIGPRKPEPGFHPYVFAQNQDEALPLGVDPYAEFLRRGRPDGPWCMPVIEGGPSIAAAAEPVQLKAALHIHAYYTDQIPDIVGRLEHSTTRPDLFVSVRSEADGRTAHKLLSKYSGRVACVAVVPNAGRDIGPFLTEFGPQLVRDYDVVGHVHTKQSLHVRNTDAIAQWVAFVNAAVLGGKADGAMVDHILGAMQQNDKIGIVYPDDPNLMDWTGNRRYAQRLADEMGLGPLPDTFNFPMGTMFWMRSAVLKEFVDLGLTWSDYPCEPIASDGTVLHALERLFGVAPQLQGWQTAVTNIPGRSR